VAVVAVADADLVLPVAARLLRSVLLLLSARFAQGSSCEIHIIWCRAV